jgi:hypothetical protein
VTYPPPLRRLPSRCEVSPGGGPFRWWVGRPLTGTPEGVGPLTDGDEVPVTVELAGTLTNRVVIRD